MASDKRSVPVPNDHEVRLSDDEFIVSKTDLTGVITYTNRIFMQIAGYSELELLDVQHNIVRHPDMPRGVFRFMWHTLEKDEEFFGYVKNLCKSGAHYWVLAHVTPDYDVNGKKSGYYSVRRKPTRAAIATMGPIYAEMLKLEQEVGRKAAPDASIELLKSKLGALGMSYYELVMSLDEESAS